MKQQYILLLLIFIVKILCAQDIIYIASEPDYPPFCIVDENGEADGFSIDLFKASASVMGLDVEIKVDNWAIIKEELAKGEIDSIIPLNIELTGFVQDFSFAVKEGNKDLLAKLNEGLALVIANGTYAAVHKKWFTPKMQSQVSTIEVLIKSIYIIIPLIILISLISVLILRSKVRQKTSDLRMEIIERKSTEKLLFETKEYLENLLSYANAPIIVWDRNYKITRFNKAFQKLTHLSESQAIGKDLSILFPKSSKSTSMKIIKSSTGERWESVEIPIFTNGTGEIRTVLWNSAFILEKENNTIVATIAQGVDITERKKAEEKVKHQLLEKEIILKETHHRIKNNFATLVSLLSLQTQSTSNKEAQSSLQDAIGRVNSMNLLYDKLLLTDDYRITSVQAYLSILIDDIIGLFPGELDLTVEKHLVDFNLEPNLLVPLGIIVNELLTNIMKYAFNNSKTGKIVFTLKKDDDHIILSIQDNGHGIPKGFDISKSTGFGLKLVQLLSQQLKGTYTIENNNGVKSIFEFWL